MMGKRQNDIGRGRRQQKKIVGRHRERMRGVVRPYMKDKKRAGSREIEEKQGRIYGTGMAQKEKARGQQKDKHRQHQATTVRQKGHIRDQQLKQRQIGRGQKEQIHDNMKPIMETGRKKVEDIKRRGRLEGIKNKKLIFSYSTMPSKTFADSMTHSPKGSTVPDPEFAGKITYSPKASTVGDLDFAEKMRAPRKVSMVPKHEFAEGMKHTTAQLPLTYSPKCPTVRPGRTQEEGRLG